MKMNQLSLAGSMGSLAVCAVSSVLMGVYPALASGMGGLSILSATVFFASVFKWLNRLFQAETGAALSDYMHWLYSGLHPSISLRQAD